MDPDSEPPAAESPLGRAIATLRQPVVLEGRPIERTLAQLATTTPGRRSPRLLLVGLGLAAALALLVTNAGRREAANSPAGHQVRFALRAPAERVTVIGDFNDWDPTATPLTRRDGEWSATVALKPGRYRYAFLVDGSRLEADPAGPAAGDEFGGPASAVTVAN
jgi:hypothetical protein